MRRKRIMVTALTIHEKMTVMMTKRWRYLFIPAVLLATFLSSTVLAQQKTYIRFVQQGLEQIKAGDYRAAKDSFFEAFRINDNDAGAHFGLGLACFHLHEDNDAERELSRAAVLDPGFSPAYQWLGEVYYRRDDPESALIVWERALALNPAIPGLKDRIDRVRREYLAEKDFNRELSSHFQIKYEGREKEDAGRLVRSILEDAYSDVGRALSYYPDAEIQVILYSGQQFREVTEAPGWSGGIFDGKIRLPVGGIEKETPGLRRLLYHEYTHAMVRAVTPRCPTWLNEGLAQYFEGRQVEGGQLDALRKLAQTDKLPRLSSLEGSFTSLDTVHATNAYLASLSAVRYLIDDYGMYRVRMVLDALASGADTAHAISIGTAFSYDEFEQGWKRTLGQ